MNNMIQITNFDLDGASEVTKIINKGGDADMPSIRQQYKIITSTMLKSDNIFKFGYCTNDNEGMNFPIFLVLNGIETKFQIGKTGMFEFQPEEWKDVNDDNIERTAQVSLSEILVPSGYPFCIDYCYSI